MKTLYFVLRQTGKTWPSCAPAGYEVARSFAHKKNADKWAAKVAPRYIDPAPVIVVGAESYEDLRRKVASTL